jgi:hypothetical protein
MIDATAPGLADVDVLRGLLYAHDRANANTAALHQASATLDAVVETLIAEGVLDPAGLDERRIHEPGWPASLRADPDPEPGRG